MVVLLTVRLKILGLIPLVVLLVFVGIRWNIEEELSWPITPDIVPIANNRASYDWVVGHRCSSPHMSCICAHPIFLVSRSIHWLLSRLNSRISLAHSFINQETSIEIRILSFLLWRKERNLLHLVLLRCFFNLFGKWLLSRFVLRCLLCYPLNRVVLNIESEIKFRSFTFLVRFLNLFIQIINVID